MGKKTPFHGRKPPNDNPNLLRIPLTGSSNQHSDKKHVPVLSSNSITSNQSLRNEMSHSSIPSNMSTHLLPSQTFRPGGLSALSNEKKSFPSSSSSRESGVQSTSYPVNTRVPNPSNLSGNATRGPNVFSKTLNIEEFGSMDSDNEDDITTPLIQTESIWGGRIDGLKIVDDSIDGVPVGGSTILSSRYPESSKGYSAKAALLKDPLSKMESFTQALKYPDSSRDESKIINPTLNDQFLRKPMSSSIRNRFMRPDDGMVDLTSEEKTVPAWALKPTSSPTKGKFVRPDESVDSESLRERKRNDRAPVNLVDLESPKGRRRSDRSPINSTSRSVGEATSRRQKERRDSDKRDSRSTTSGDADRKNTLLSDSKPLVSNQNRERFLRETSQRSSKGSKKEDIKAVKLSWHSTPVDRRKGESDVSHEKESIAKNPLLRGLKQAIKNSSREKVKTEGFERVSKKFSSESGGNPETQNYSSSGSIPSQQSLLQNASMGLPANTVLPQDQASMENVFMGLLNNFNNQGFVPNTMGIPGNLPVHPEQLLMQSGGLSALGNTHMPSDQMFMQNANMGLPANIGLHPSAIQEALMQQEAFMIQSSLLQNAVQGGMPAAGAQSFQQASNTQTLHSFPQSGMQGSAYPHANTAPHGLPSSALLNIPQGAMQNRIPVQNATPLISNNPVQNMPFVPTPQVDQSHRPFDSQEDRSLITYPHSSLNRTPPVQNQTMKTPFYAATSIPPPSAPQVYRSGAVKNANMSPAVDEVMKRLAPDGTGCAKYPAPDTNLLLFDPEIGYRYDPGTGLHYDANSGYFFNSKMKVFLYWDLFTQTYLRVENPTIPFPILHDKKEPTERTTTTDSSIIDMKKLIEQHRQIKLDKAAQNNSPKSKIRSRSGSRDRGLYPKKKRWDDYDRALPSIKRRSISPRNSNNARNDRRESGSPDNRRPPLRRSPLRRRSHSKSPLALPRKRSPSPGSSRRMDIRSRTRSPDHGRRSPVSSSLPRKRARSKSPLWLSRKRSPSPGRREKPINSGRRPRSRSPLRKRSNSRSPVRLPKKHSPSSGPSRGDNRSKSPGTTRAGKSKRQPTSRSPQRKRFVARGREQRRGSSKDVSAHPSLTVTVINIPTEGVSIGRESPNRKLSIDGSTKKDKECTDSSRKIGSELKGPVEKKDEKTKDSKVSGGKDSKDKKSSNKEKDNKSSDKRCDRKDREKNSGTTRPAKQKEDSPSEGRNHRLASERHFSSGPTRTVFVKGFTFSQDQISQSKPMPSSEFDALSAVESKGQDVELVDDLSGVPDDLSDFVILDGVEDEEESNDEMTEEALQLLLSDPVDPSEASKTQDKQKEEGDDLYKSKDASATSAGAENDSSHSINKSGDSSTHLKAVPNNTGNSETSSCVHETISQDKSISGGSNDDKIQQNVDENDSRDKPVLQQISTYSEPPSPSCSIFSSYDFSDDDKYVTVSVIQDGEGNEEEERVDEDKDVSSKELVSEEQNPEDMSVDESKMDTSLETKTSNPDTEDVETPKPSKATEENDEAKKHLDINNTVDDLILKTVCKNVESHQEAIVEPTVPTVSEEFRQIEDAEHVDELVKNNEPVTIQNDTEKHVSIITNEDPINDTGISFEIGEEKQVCITTNENPINDTDISTEIDEEKQVCITTNENPINDTDVSTEIDEEKQVCITRNENPINDTHTSTEIDEEKQVCITTNENPINDTDISTEIDDEKQVCITTNENPINDTHTSTEIDEEKQVCITRNENPINDTYTSTEIDEEKQVCITTNENPINDTDISTEIDEEKQVCIITNENPMNDTDISTKIYEERLVCITTDANPINDTEKSTEIYEEKQVSFTTDENPINATDKATEIDEEKQVCITANENPINDTDISTEIDEEKQVSITTDDNPINDTDKSIEFNEEKQVSITTDENPINDTDKSTEIDEEKQVCITTDDIPINDTDISTEITKEVVQIPSGTSQDEVKILAGSQENQNEEQSLGTMHVEDILDSKTSNEAATVGVSEKESGTPQGKKVGNVFARLGRIASDSGKSASVPKISENRVRGDKDPKSDLYPSQPTTIVHLKQSRPGYEPHIIRNSVYQNLIANDIDFMKITINQKNAFGSPFEFIQVTFASTDRAEKWFQLTDRKVTLQFNATCTAEYYMYYAQPIWRCSYCAKTRNIFFRSLCVSCFKHKTDPLACIKFSNTPTKYLGYGKIPPSAPLNKVMRYAPSPLYKKVNKRMRSLRVVLDPLANCCSGLVIIEMPQAKDATRIINWARAALNNQFFKYVELAANSSNPKVVIHEVPLTKPVKKGSGNPKSKSPSQQYNIRNRSEIDYELGVPRDIDESDGSHDSFDDLQVGHRIVEYNSGLEPPLLDSRERSSRYERNFSPLHHQERYRDRSMSPRRFSYRDLSPSPSRMDSPNRASSSRYVNLDSHHFSQGRSRRSRSTSRHRSSQRYRSPSPRRFSPESRHAPRRRSPSSPRSTSRAPKPDGTDSGWYYPPPDATTFQHEPQTGLLYDPSTTLYYHPQSRLFYNGDLNIYLEYDLRNNRYIIVE